MPTPVPAQRPPMPSLAEWMLRDFLSALGLLLLAVTAFVLAKVVWVLVDPMESWVLQGRLITLAVVGTPALILFFTRIRRRWLQWTLARSGTPVKGRVDEVARGNWTVNNVRYYRAEYTYSADGKEYQGRTPEKDPDKLGVSRGESIVLWVDKSNPRRHVWLDPREDYRTWLREEKIMTSLIRYPGELAFLASIVFVNLLVSLWWRDLADQAHEFARQRDPDMITFIVSLGLMVAGMVLVGWLERRKAAAWAQTSAWMVFGTGFYLPWAASGFQPGMMAFLLVLSGFVWLIGKKGTTQRRQ